MIDDFQVMGHEMIALLVISHREVNCSYRRIQQEKAYRILSVSIKFDQLEEEGIINLLSNAGDSYLQVGLVTCDTMVSADTC
jgi:hypothetical protein